MSACLGVKMEKHYWLLNAISGDSAFRPTIFTVYQKVKWAM
jgi:hypothetical protein